MDTEGVTYQEALDILGITDKEVKDKVKLRQSYRRAERKAHPDMGGSEDAFHKVKIAERVVDNYKPTTRIVFSKGSIFDFSTEAY